MNITKKKQTHRYREQSSHTCGERDGQDRGRGLRRTNYLLSIRLKNKVLLYSTGNYIQYPVINHNGKEYEKEYIYTYN